MKTLNVSTSTKVDRQSSSATKVPSPPRRWQARRLVSAMWRSPDLHHQLSIRDPREGSFRNVPVKGVDEAIDLTLRYSAEGFDVYFACAEYRTPDSRTAANAAGAWAFWLDIDCGADKAEAGKGYATEQEACDAIKALCNETGLPLPTIVIPSGGGLHVYWALDGFLPKERWLEVAKKLKALCKTLGLLADPSRTADLASVLRLPETLNRKYDPPRPVRLAVPTKPAIATQFMVDALNRAYEKLCRPSEQVSTPVRHLEPTPITADTMVRLRSALSVLDPDCDEVTWKLSVLAPLARLARDNPTFAADLYQLAREWSSGELRGKPSVAWTMPGRSNGRTGEAVFDEVWNRFLKDDYAGQPTTLGTIFHAAKEAGWGEDMFTAVETKEDPLATALSIGVRVLAAVERDVGAPFEPEAIAALALIRQRNRAEYQRIRSGIKKVNASVLLKDLDDATRVRNTATVQTHHGYACSLLERLAVDGWRPVGHGGVLYVVNATSSLWEPQSPEALERKVAESFDGQDQCRRAGDYRAIAQHAISLADDQGAFEKAPLGVACPDGFFRIKGTEIIPEPLTPAHRQRVMIPVTPSRQPTPLFGGLLRETFQSDIPGEEEQQIRLVQEIAGAIMLGIMHRFQKAVLFYDPFGRAGKGTLERIFRALVPPSLVTAVSPFRWNNDYHLAALAGSRLNVVGELPDESPIPAADFKTVIGGDLLTGRHPSYRPFSFKNEAAHLFMSNHLINTRDHSEAFFSRWLLVEFPNSRLRSGLPIDPGLADRIIAEELPGIAQWALEGAVRLLAQGRFSPSVVHERLMAKWRRSSNSVEEFVHDNCEVGDPLYLTRRSQLYVAYCEWAKETGRRPFAKGRFKDLLLHNAPLGVSLSEINGYETFRGIRLKEFVSLE